MSRPSLSLGVSGFLRKENTTRMLLAAIAASLAGKVFLCPESATALAQTLRERRIAPSRPALSPQDLRLLRGIALGRSYKEISVDLGVTPKSVETYRRRLARRLGLSTRADLVRYAAGEGITAAS